MQASSFRALTTLVAATVLAASIGIANIALPLIATPSEAIALDSETTVPGFAADWWRAFGHDGLSSIVDCAYRQSGARLELSLAQDEPGSR